MQLDGCDGEIYGTIRVMSIMNIVSLEFVSDFIVLILDIMCTVSTILNPPPPPTLYARYQYCQLDWLSGEEGTQLIII